MEIQSILAVHWGCDYTIGAQSSMRCSVERRVVMGVLFSLLHALTSNGAVYVFIYIAVLNNSLLTGIMVLRVLARTNHMRHHRKATRKMEAT